MTVFWPEKAALVAVNSAFPRLVRGRFGNLSEDALMVAQFIMLFVMLMKHGLLIIIGRRSRRSHVAVVPVLAFWRYLKIIVE